MTIPDQITKLEREAVDLERLSHECGRLDLEAPAKRAARIAADRREKLEQLRGTP